MCYVRSHLEACENAAYYLHTQMVQKLRMQGQALHILNDYIDIILKT